VDRLAQGIAKIGATMYPNEVIIRFSDFKTNEYSKLVGGDMYEPHEENPMLGWRGASRYYDPKFKVAFGLECAAMRQVRDEMGLTNVVPMVPFCRTPEEGRKVVEAMAEHGLDRTKDKKLKVYVMCEIPSNILLADEFLEIFDGMSIGSNDLTQLVLGLDRDSGIVTHIANENNPAVKKMISEIIHKCKTMGKYIGICGQAPSDYPEFAKFLIDEGIESMSLNPDTVIKTIMELGKKEKKPRAKKTE
jgi:pyruvate,water dikinase